MAFRQVNVTTTVGEVASFNEKRTSIVIFNNGTGRVFISQNQANVSTEGFPLDVGGAIGLTEQDGDEPWLQYFAISAAGTQDIRVVEGYGRKQ